MNYERDISYYGDYEKDLPSKISRCNICHKFFDSKKDLKAHKDKEHRITNHKILKNKKTTS
jgi:hypothetical protein